MEQEEVDDLKRMNKNKHEAPEASLRRLYEEKQYLCNWKVGAAQCDWT